MKEPIPLLGDHKPARFPGIGDQQLINLIPMLWSDGAKNSVTLGATPGVTKIGNMGAGGGIGARSNLYLWKKELYGVIGSTLFKFDSLLNFTALGTINTITGRCILTGGRSHLGVVDGDGLYYTDGTTLTQLTSGVEPDFPYGATHLAYLDGRFIANNPNTDQFFISASEDITSWSALDFATAEKRPDDIYAIDANTSDIYFFGNETIQIFYNSGNPSFPFDPYPQTMEYGIQAVYSLARDDEALYVLASKPQGGLDVRKIVGLQSVSILSPEMEWALNNLSVTADAEGGILNLGGVNFYVLTFPYEDLTFAFNTKNGFCFRLKTYGENRYAFGGFKAINNKIYCLSYKDTGIYQLDFSAFTNNGEVIERYRRTAVIQYKDRRLMHKKVVIDAKVGVGNSNDTSPIIELRWSDDNAHTWSSWVSRSLGALGAYNTRCEWNKLGLSRQRIYEFRCTDMVDFQVVNGYLDAELLDD